MRLAQRGVNCRQLLIYQNIIYRQLFGNVRQFIPFNAKHSPHERKYILKKLVLYRFVFMVCHVEIRINIGMICSLSRICSTHKINCTVLYVKN